MIRQRANDVDGRWSPALASTPHHSPRPRVARRGGAHAPPKGVLAELASTDDCGATPGRVCSVRSCAIDEALKEAARDARRFHKAMGNSMATWVDGHVVLVQPEDIVVDDEPVPSAQPGD